MENLELTEKSMPLTNQESDTKTKPKRKLLGRIFKYSALGFAAFIVLLYFLFIFWKMGGSNKWELEIDKDGTTVYSLKSPGASTIKFKAITQYDYTISQMIASFNDEGLTEDCDKYMPGCTEYRFIQPWDTNTMSNVQYWRFSGGGVFADREMVLRGIITQDPKTREVLLENIAVPNAIPADDCCVRVAHMHNTWRFTPLESGRLQVEYVQDFNMGGFFPNFLLSFGAAMVYKNMVEVVPSIIDANSTYKNMKLDFIDE